MRIGLFSDTYYPQINGVATSVLMLKEFLDKQGHEVYVFTTTDPDTPECEHNVYRVPSIPVSVRRLGAFFSPQLRAAIDALGLEIVHTHTEFSLGLYGRHIAKALGLPQVHTMHTIYEDYTNYVNKIESLEPAARIAARKMTAAFCNGADAVIVPTDKVKDLLLTYGVERRIAIIPTGIRLDRFCAKACPRDRIDAIRMELGIAERDKVLVNIGRISDEKNIDVIIKALAEYIRTHVEAKLLLVGDGPARDSLQKLSRKLGISGNVIFAGMRSWDDIGLYYRIGQVFVSASTSETQGLTYVEALASGLPVIAKDDPCLDGIVKEGENGYLFTTGEEFCDALDKVLYDPPVLSRMSQAAAESAKVFSADSYARSVAEFYQSILETADY